MELLLYCVKCRKKTESEAGGKTIKTKNNRFRLISNCCICGTKKSSFVKKQTGGDLVDVISSTIGEIHLPGHNFTGPGTKLQERLERGDKPVNRVDEISKKHDIAYSKNKDKKSRHIADREMLQELDEITNPTTREKIERAVVKPIIKTKLKLGLGVPTGLKDEVRLENNKES